VGHYFLSNLCKKCVFLKVNSDYFLVCDILVELCNSVQMCFLLGGNQLFLILCTCI
jgi:hypothetical protein